MNDKELIIYCDESDSRGAYFSNFYGGLMVGSSSIDRVSSSLDEKKLELNINGELKWQKVSRAYLEKYKEMVDCLFDEVRNGTIKIRIMFRQNAYVPTGLTKEDREHEYFKLYYQFIKHAFGLAYLESERGRVKIRLYLDRLPDTKEKVAIFKGHVAALCQSSGFRRAGVIIQQDNIAEVDSKEHILLQCLDVVLGAMNFRLNDKHKAIPDGKNRRGARTIAKEKLYKHILRNIRELKSHFNIGISTGNDGDKSNRFHYPYLHWCFEPSRSELDSSLTKRGKKK